MSGREQPNSDRQTTPAPHVGLLAQVMSNTLDEDYQTVATRGAKTGPRSSPQRVALAAVVVAFGVMIGVSALKTEQDRPEALAERAELVEQIHLREQRYDDRRATEGDLQIEVTRLQKKVADDTRSNTTLSTRLELLGLDAGTLAATGPGIAITVDNAPQSSGQSGGTILDTDLRQLVNGLWKAGAEAVAIDGHRLSPLTSIRYAGKAITVDYRSLTPPYVVEAIGDPDTLPARLLETSGGQTWLSLEANFAIRFDTETKDMLTVPADPHDRLLYAEPEGLR
ncbi:MAG: DUF881 domain-containing protein [Actinomycetota bacterium]|nr:DUF881 domain-containing protein [Actinomycetota bacterium]